MTLPCCPHPMVAQWCLSVYAPPSGHRHDPNRRECWNCARTWFIPCPVDDCTWRAAGDLPLDGRLSAPGQSTDGASTSSGDKAVARGAGHPARHLYEDTYPCLTLTPPPE